MQLLESLGVPSYKQSLSDFYVRESENNKVLKKNGEQTRIMDNVRGQSNNVRAEGMFGDSRNKPSRDTSENRL